ncbi:aly/REF export factor 2-like isoform X1 [Artemia franciscana]|uniref:aly/REF export factor 2-like isoform X1 n=2 Tax=Artemia franciscana TaxID=6661 RepID=UPI0032DAA928
MVDCVWLCCLAYVIGWIEIMSSDIELSLDEIIKKKKISITKFRGGRVSKGNFQGNRPLARRPSAPYKRGNLNDKWSHDLYDGGEPARRSRSISEGAASSKIIISNLDFGVSDSDIKELFGECGPIRSSAVHYDKSGRSLGSAHVQFERTSDAIKALNQYNGVPLDGKEMKIEFATGGSAGGGKSITSRLGGSPPFRSSFQRRDRSEFTRGGGRGRGRREEGRGRGRPQVTAEDLDKELDAYRNKMETD